ncbi:MAG: hypothetical protein E7323_05045 [Clostridiales bacterium]|nr:hypothetical protein [Clostridiales bacterium]
MGTALDRRIGELGGNTDTSLLKLLALVFMLIDHIGARVLPGIQELRILGRIAFPLYAWCLVVGSVKTRNLPLYAFRMLMMAVLSQPLYMMGLQHTYQELNILFTLTVALVAIYGIQKRFMFSQIWVPVLCYLLLGYIQVDYGWKGLTFILILYLARESRRGLIAAFLAYCLFWGSGSATVNNLFGWELPFLKWAGIKQPLQAFFKLQTMAWLALPLIAIPTNSGFKMPKWLGYALYPMHLVLLIILRLLFTNATLASMTAMF